MTEIDRGRLAALAGFATTTVLLVLTVVAFLNDALESFGWQGGEYAYSFIWIALGSAIAGLVVKVAAPAPWRSAGTGMALAGTVGVVVVITLVIVFMWALSNLTA
ncbi:hypothetical protein SK571_04695 [Lentzea sp. BCCO 10_0798]|uniref:Uncharacterized protein n=1 Tax=Lentzea kristufekii TaxID=3095430 RepID=A0ABU4TK63_9PSEU|nr:hypothetical protein [Lentzea sp. BCCO 10_0798]MDX8048667.1 hypothetical protein [Lentzea sp. BCCO 10_0798]